MGSLSPLHWLVVIGVVVLLFGSGKVSGLMGDVAKGIKTFKKPMAEPDDASMASTADKPAEGPTGTIQGPGVTTGSTSNTTTTASHS